MTDPLRMKLLAWVQEHHIQRYSDKSVVSHGEGLEDLLSLMEPELIRLRRIEAAARAYVNSDPPRPEWRELAHSLDDPDRAVWRALDGEPPNEHPIAGELHPKEKPCSSFMADGRSEICARCDWPEEAHGGRGD